MKRFSYRTIVLALLALAIGTFLLFRARSKPDPTLAWSLEAIRAFGGDSIYFNPPAQVLVSQVNKKAVTAAGGQIARFGDAPINTPVFRQLDRKLRFDSLVLAGDPALYFPLLQHLLDTGDWTLVYVNHLLMIFQRLPDKAWTVAHLAPIEKKIAQLPAESQAAALIALANQLQALRQLERARPLIDRALALEVHPAAAQNQLARYYSQKRNFPKALDAVNNALAQDDDFAGALFMKTQILLTMGKAAEAYPISKKLLRRSPNDPQVLYLHAKVAHGVRALTEEREVLEKLLKLAEAAGQPTGTYRVYLGQAYSANGDAAKALQQFEAALKTDELPPDQRQFATEAVDRLKPALEPAS